MRNFHFKMNVSLFLGPYTFMVSERGMSGYVLEKFAPNSPEHLLGHARPCVLYRDWPRSTH